MPPKTKDPKEAARLAFVRGELDQWDAGTHGYSVRCLAVSGKLKIRWTQPVRKQETLFVRDTVDLREKLTVVARLDVVNRNRSLSAIPNVRGRPEEPAPSPTVREVWLRYIKGQWPTITPGVIAGGRAARRDFYLAMTPDERKRVPEPEYLASVIQAMNRVIAFTDYQPDRRIVEIEPASWKAYTFWRTTQGVTPNGGIYSLSTIATDYTRFHTAIKYCKTEHRIWWNGVHDPLEGAKVNRERSQVPEISEVDCHRLMKELETRPGSWRTDAAVRIAFSTGRRIGAIGADTLGFDGDGLRATDFDEIDGVLHVTWRAAAAKGRAYGKGDTTVKASRDLAETYRWLRETHPNPLGPEHPLIWSPDDPSVPVSYASLNRGFKDAWKTAFGTPAPKGLAFHGFCRTVVTTIADRVGIGAAAEYTGRTQATAEQHYKRVRVDSLNRTVDALDEVRGAHRPAVATG